MNNMILNIKSATKEIVLGKLNSKIKIIDDHF